MIIKYTYLAEFIASLAGLLSIIAYIPQTYKVYLTNQTEDLDINTFGLLLIIKFLWIIWGFLIGSISVILFGVLQMSMVSYIVLKINKNYENNIYYHKHYYDNYMRVHDKH